MPALSALHEDVPWGDLDHAPALLDISHYREWYRQLDPHGQNIHRGRAWRSGGRPLSQRRRPRPRSARRKPVSSWITPSPCSLLELSSVIDHKSSHYVQWNIAHPDTKDAVRQIFNPLRRPSARCLIVAARARQTIFLASRRTGARVSKCIV